MRTAGNLKNSFPAERCPRLLLGSICSFPRLPQYRRTRLDIPPKLSRGHAQPQKVRLHAKVGNETQDALSSANGYLQSERRVHDAQQRPKWL